MRDEEKIREIYERCADDLYRLCWFYSGNREDAQDAVQNALVKLMEHGGEFESDSHAKGWLLKTGVNECRQIRRQWWKKRVHIEEDLSIYGQETEQEDRELLAVISALPEKYRIPMYMYYYEGYQTEEIAKMLGKRASTVRSWLLRGRRYLREALEMPEQAKADGKLERAERKEIAR